MADIRRMLGASSSAKKSPKKQEGPSTKSGSSKTINIEDDDVFEVDKQKTKSPQKSINAEGATDSPSSGKRKRIKTEEKSEDAVAPSSSSAPRHVSHQPRVEPTFKERPSAPAAASSEHELWADKYAPKTFDDLVGAQSIVKSLTKWLEEWDDVHLRKRIKIPYDRSNPGARAALLSGPPGIGKTTTARLVADVCGREVFELNASDTRSKRLLSEELADVVQAGVVSFGGKKEQKRRLVVMDEVDGMSASDRGGIAELIKIIKTTKTPIICICNDYSKSSVRSLANHCFDLKFQRPQAPSIAKRLKDVARREKLAIDDEALEGIIKSAGNDIRQVLNALQMWNATSNRVSSAEAKERIGSITKDAVLRLSAFDATRYIFCESHNAPLNNRNEAFFADYDMIPLMVSQNYIGAVQNSRTCPDELAKLRRLSLAADAVCDADLIAKYVRTDQRWDLLTSQAMLNIRVAHLCDGGIGFPGFPEWLGKNSNAMKRARLLGELTTHVRSSKSATSTDRNSLRLDYVPAMRTAFVIPLSNAGTDAVDKVIDYLDDYSMNRDDLFETLSELQFPEGPGFKDYFKTIPSAAKAAFTREYNKRSHKSQLLVLEDSVGKKSKRRMPSVAADDGGGEDDDEEAVEEEEEDVDVDAFRAKSKKSSAATSSSKKKVKSGK